MSGQNSNVMLVANLPSKNAEMAASICWTAASRFVR